jgi:tetratricopeptide (TPR) repeat protein
MRADQTSIPPYGTTQTLSEWKDTLEVQRYMMGEHHEDTARTHYWIGRCFQAQGKSDESVSSFLSALKIQDAVLGRSHESACTTLYWLGHAYLNAGKFDQSMYTFRAIEERRHETPINSMTLLFWKVARKFAIIKRFILEWCHLDCVLNREHYYSKEKFLAACSIDRSKLFELSSKHQNMIRLGQSKKTTESNVWKPVYGRRTFLSALLVWLCIITNLTRHPKTQHLLWNNLLMHFFPRPVGSRTRVVSGLWMPENNHPTSFVAARQRSQKIN